MASLRWLFSGSPVQDGITLSHPPVTTFEIRISEADSPDAGFKLISNVVSGPVIPASAR